MATNTTLEGTMMISDLAREAHGFFETATRPGGEPFTRTRDDAPAWIDDLVRSAHGDMLPDDWRYDCIRAALSEIADAGAEGADDVDDVAHDFADGMVDVCTSELFQWAASHAFRPEYADEAAREDLVDADASIGRRLMIGQYEEAREVFALVVAALECELGARES